MVQQKNVQKVCFVHCVSSDNWLVLSLIDQKSLLIKINWPEIEYCQQVRGDITRHVFRGHAHDDFISLDQSYEGGERGENSFLEMDARAGEAPRVMILQARMMITLH